MYFLGIYVILMHERHLLGSNCFSGTFAHYRPFLLYLQSFVKPLLAYGVFWGVQRSIKYIWGLGVYFILLGVFPYQQPIALQRHEDGNTSNFVYIYIGGVVFVRASFLFYVYINGIVPVKHVPPPSLVYWSSFTMPALSIRWH